jgi:REP element-mobilizing transposase RayT
MRHDNFIPQARIIAPRSRGRLPHWQVDNATYFVTFRLRDSLPREVARELFDERERLLRSCSTASERARIDIAFSVRLDRELDAGYGSCVLRDENARIAADALHHFDGKRYNLHAWCVMPNHVHVLLYLASGAEMPGIIHSWKSYTAHAIGRGPIWQREYFDRVVRSPREFSDTRAYIHANPGRAGLRDWPWVG